MFEAVTDDLKVRLRAAGVRRLALFGSVARGEARPESDVDVFIEFQPESRTYANLCAVAELLETAFGRKVDLVTADALSPYIGPHIRAEAKYVDLAA